MGRLGDRAVQPDLVAAPPARDHGAVAVLKKRPEPYWGGDVSLDEIRIIDLGADEGATLPALASGQIDSMDELKLTTVEAPKNIPNGSIQTVAPAQTGGIRVNPQHHPFHDNRVRPTNHI